MRTSLWILLTILLPGTALALSYERQNLLYTDAPFSPAVSAGVSVLTSLGAVEGYPDGSFHPERTLNRAEFVKIAIASHPTIRLTASDTARCFPDVKREHWFSAYVCPAKERGVIAGYPDGNFRPANPVNYVEALKILSELYNYTTDADPDAEWWRKYVRAAQTHRTILPVNMAYDRYITRGQMARLAAAYRAEYEGELDMYRRMEAGENVASSGSSSSSTSSSSTSTGSSSVASSVSSSSSSSTVSAVYTAPTSSKILLIGEQHAIGDAMLYPQERDARLRIIKVILEREARSLEEVYLMNEDGETLATLSLDVHDDDNETWRADLPSGTGSFVFPGGEGTRVFVVAKISDWNNGGFAEDYIAIDSLFVVMEKVNNTVETYQVVPSNAHYPAHQTALATVTDVENVLQGTGQLVTGKNQMVAAFRFRSEDVNGIADPRLNHLRFHVDAADPEVYENPRLASGDSFKHDCSMDSNEPSIVSCLALPEDIGRFENDKRTVELYLDVDADAAPSGSKLQVSLLEPGSMDDSGDVRYTDGSADFIWINGTSPLARGKVWVKE